MTIKSQELFQQDDIVRKVTSWTGTGSVQIEGMHRNECLAEKNQWIELLEYTLAYGFSLILL